MAAKKKARKKTSKKTVAKKATARKSAAKKPASKMSTAVLGSSFTGKTVDRPQPPDWPNEDQKQFMMETYGKILTWKKWLERSDRFAKPAHEITYDKDGFLDIF